MRRAGVVGIAAGCLLALEACTTSSLLDQNYACRSDEDCVAGYVCVTADGEPYGVCRQGETSAADLTGGSDGDVDPTAPTVL